MAQGGEPAEPFDIWLLVLGVSMILTKKES